MDEYCYFPIKCYPPFGLLYIRNPRLCLNIQNCSAVDKHWLHNVQLTTRFTFIGDSLMESVQVRGFLWSFVTSLFFLRRVVSPMPNSPSWRITPCRLSAAAYSIYSQLPSIFGGRLLHPQNEGAPSRGDKKTPGLSPPANYTDRATAACRRS
jgi:hypothetical protein